MSDTPTKAILDVRNLTKRFQGLVSVNAVGFELREGEILALIGSPVAGSMSDATAAMPKAIEPSRFNATIHHDRVRSRKHTQRWHTSA